MIAITVIITDWRRAVLFTCYNQEYIEREVAEHFPDQKNVEIFACSRERPLAWWPADDMGGWSLKKHEVPCDRIYFPSYLRRSMERLEDGP